VTGRPREVMGDGKLNRVCQGGGEPNLAKKKELTSLSLPENVIPGQNGRQESSYGGEWARTTPGILEVGERNEETDTLYETIQSPA